MTTGDRGQVLSLLDEIDMRLDELRAIMGQPRLDLEVRRALAFLDVLGGER
jgi:hypothetical protein